MNRDPSGERVQPLSMANGANSERQHRSGGGRRDIHCGEAQRVDLRAGQDGRKPSSAVSVARLRTIELKASRPTRSQTARPKLWCARSTAAPGIEQLAAAACDASALMPVSVVRCVSVGFGGKLNRDSRRRSVQLRSDRLR
jgi:hypothetical protein